MKLHEHWRNTVDNSILEKRTSRSAMDLGRWFEACWMPDRFADFAIASRIMIFTRITRLTIYGMWDHLKYLNIETEKMRWRIKDQIGGFVLFVIFLSYENKITNFAKIS